MRYLKTYKQINELHSDTYKSAFEKSGNPKFLTELHKYYGQPPYSVDDLEEIVGYFLDNDIDLSKMPNYLKENGIVDVVVTNLDPETKEELEEYKKEADRLGIDYDEEIAEDYIQFMPYPDNDDSTGEDSSYSSNKGGGYHSLGFSGRLVEFYTLMAYLMGHKAILINLVNWYNDMTLAIFKD